LNYIKIGFVQVIFSNAKVANFSMLTNELRDGKNIVLFSFMIMTFIMFLISPMSNILNWVLGKGDKKSIIQKILGLAIAILALWFYLWKLPKFLFSFFTLAQNFYYLLSFLLGLFFAGVIFYIVTFLFCKMFLRDDNKMTSVY
jgi:uncharacterized membrane protein YhdT